MKTLLKDYNNSWYNPGNSVKRALWFIINPVFVSNTFNPSSRLKVFFLRLFGSHLGKNIVIKPGVFIKYPWYLTLADNVWLGENVWLDNLAMITIEANVCISQGAYILTGNHNYKRSTFDLIVQPVVLEEGVWIGAKAIVCPGVRCFSHSVLTAGSVATKDLESYSIYTGNPAEFTRKRIISDIQEKVF